MFTITSRNTTLCDRRPVRKDVGAKPSIKSDWPFETGSENKDDAGLKGRRLNHSVRRAELVQGLAKFPPAAPANLEVK